MRECLRMAALAGLTIVLSSLVAGRAAAGPCEEWDALQKQIRDQAIPRQEAQARIAELHERLSREQESAWAQSGFVFPVEGATARDIGGRNGKGFIANGYDFYEGNRHGGHPAQDIFVPDRNQDGLRDDTGKPVAVLAFATGIVVGANGEWHDSSDLRGGNYVWVFTPALQRYCYYAHLEQVFVKTGDVVPAGTRLGLLGRTGKNAAKKRSPTHLHFGCLLFDQGRMTPHNPYDELLGARRE
jgi:peptidoglycan LD-endopeptidase LytH